MFTSRTAYFAIVLASALCAPQLCFAQSTPAKATKAGCLNAPNAQRKFKQR
jgi:hypothetical protein